MKLLNKLNNLVSNIAAITLLLLILNVFIDVVLRYFFNTTVMAMQEMEWHLFSVMFLLGVSYALASEGHVRVDFFYDNFKPKNKAIINVIGTLFFLIPFSLFIAYGSYEFVHDSYMYNEISGDPGGLTHRWLIKALIPLSFILLILASINYIYNNILLYKEDKNIHGNNDVL